MSPQWAWVENDFSSASSMLVLHYVFNVGLEKAWLNSIWTVDQE